MRAYFVTPDGAHFMQLSMGGAPPLYRQPVSHPELRRIDGLNPAATHLEFARTNLYSTTLGKAASLTSRSTGLQIDERLGVGVGLRLYVFARAVRHVGPLIDDQWQEVPWHVPS